MRQAKKGRPSARRRIRHGAGCPPQPASRLAGAGSGTQRRCGVQAAGLRGCAPVDTEVKIPFDLPIRIERDETVPYTTALMEQISQRAVQRARQGEKINNPDALP